MIRVKPLREILETTSLLESDLLSSESQSGLQDLKETCFFCLKSLEKQESRKRAPFLSHLSQICRYLDIDFQDGHLKGRNSSKKKCGVQRDEEVSVMFCEGCAHVACELSNYCRQLEVTQGWVDYFFRQLTEIFQQSPESSMNGEMSKVNILRMLTQEKSLTKLQSSLQMRPSNLETREDTVHSKRAPSKCSPEILKHPPASIPAKATPKSSMIIDKRQSTSSCPFCDHTQMDSEELNFHTVSCHPEQLLSSMKRADVSEQVFKTLCQQLIKRMTNVECENGKFTCLYCPASYTDKKFISSHTMASHMYIIGRKLDTLQSKVNKSGSPDLNFLLQTKPTSSKQTTSKPAVSTEPVPKKLSRRCYCYYCKRRFTYRYSMKRHVLMDHQQLVKINLPDCSVSLDTALNLLIYNSDNKVSCDLCGTKVQNLPRHLKRFCTARKRKRQVSTGTSNSKKNKKKRVRAETPPIDLTSGSDTELGNESFPMDEISWECVECKKLFPTTDALEQHTKLGCQNDQTKDADTDAKTRKFECSTCGASYFHRSNLRRHNQQCIPDLGVVQNRVRRTPIFHSCMTCGKQFTRKTNLNNHIMKMSHMSCAVDPSTPDSLIIASTFSLDAKDKPAPATISTTTNEMGMKVVTISRSHYQPKGSENSGGKASGPVVQEGNCVAEDYFDEGDDGIEIVIPEDDPLEI